MKRINYLALAAAGLLMASCSQEDLVGPAQNGEGNYHVTVSLPSELGTRAMNDGLTANNLIYYVYDVDDAANPVYVFEGKAQFDNSLSTEVNLDLVAGKNFKLAFFAYADGAFAETGNTVYQIDKTTGTLSVNYDAMTNAGLEQNDTYDCFLNTIETGVIGSTVVASEVILYRPMAQINWGTSDLYAPLVQSYFGGTTTSKLNVLPYLQSSLTVQAYSQYDMLNNDVMGTQTEMTLNPYVQPTTPGNTNTLVNFPINSGTFKYVAMQYVLVPKDGCTADLSLNINNGYNNPGTEKSVNYDVEVSNAPLQANYQTNIYGSLFTDNVNLTVTKLKNWTGVNNLPQGPVGEEVSEGLLVDDNTRTITITSLAGLQTYAETLINNTTPANVEWASGSSWSLYTTFLDTDIDFGASKTANWTPFPNRSMTFDGQNHKISNMYVDVTGQWETEAHKYPVSAGFMTTAIGTVQNLVFENATVKGNYKAAVLAGDGDCAKISGITVNTASVTSTPILMDNGLYDHGNNVGGVVGYLCYDGGNAWCNNCEVNNLSITGYAKVGGVVGYGNGPANITGNTVNTATVTATMKLPENGKYDGTKPFNAGEIAGGWTNNAIVDNNKAENVKVYTINGEGQVVITDLSQLQNFADSGWQAYFGKTFTFEKDAVMDLGGATIEPINFSANSDVTNVTIDGNGVTIKNFKIVGPGAGNHTGLFANVHGTISNINIENMTIEDTSGHGNVGVIGYMVGNVSNIKVSNSKISTNEKNAGAIVGLFTEGSSTMTNCSAINCTISALDRAGGLVGCANAGGNREFIDCTVSGCDITSQLTGENSGAGSFIGVAYTPTTVSYSGTNTVTNTKVNGVEVNTPTSGYPAN